MLKIFISGKPKHGTETCVAPAVVGWTSFICTQYSLGTWAVVSRDPNGIEVGIIIHNICAGWIVFVLVQPHTK